MKTNIERAILLAAGATAISGVALAASVWRAVEIPALEPSPVAAVSSDPRNERVEFRAFPAEAVTLIAENEPFREDREPAPRPYRMPGDEPPEPERREERPPPDPPEFEVLGTVTTADGGFAVIQTPDGLPARIVDVDDTIEGYRLVSVDATGVTLEGEGQRVQLSVAAPAVLREQPERPRERDRDDRERAARQRQQAAREVLQEQTQRLRDMIQDARERGGAIQFELPGGDGDGNRSIRIVVPEDDDQ